MSQSLGEIGMASTVPLIRVTEIGEYIRHSSCARRIKLEFNNRSEAEKLPFYDRLFNPIDLVLQESGRKREDEWEESLKRAGLKALKAGRAVPEEPFTWESFRDLVAGLKAGEAVYAREVEVSAQIGAFEVKGRIDFLILLWRESSPILRVVEAKASRRDRTYHRIQLAFYCSILRDYLDSDALTVDGHAIAGASIEGVIARIDEETNKAQNILELSPLDLSMELADVERLLQADGEIAQILSQPLDDLGFKLDSKCDDCVFNIHCFPESARQRRLELLSIDPSAAKSLRDAGVQTIDDLAEVDLNGAAASLLRQDQSFTENLEELQVQARVRRKILPGGEADPDTYQVEQLPHRRTSQLPEYEHDGRRLVRIYLSVEYDYVENRVAALAAHVTASDAPLSTDFENTNGRWVPSPVPTERIREGQDAEGKPLYHHRPVQGEEIINISASAWDGRYDSDTGAERQLIQSFFRDLVAAIRRQAGAPDAPIHFYLWSRLEMRSLVEACTRAGSRLLSHLRELLGCRESLEQLIYSSLQEEISNRYALGWTGRGLSVASSLTWFGTRYHWTRLVDDQVVHLDQSFTQDIFDFKTDLELDSTGNWAAAGKGVHKHKVEIRSRFYDKLSAPYLYAYWGVLSRPHELSDARLAAHSTRYYRAVHGSGLKEFLRARVHALRWIEERIRFKSSEISKPLMLLDDLPDFSLNVSSINDAALDFLRLDQHIKLSDWLGAHLVPPAHRVPTGKTIMVRDARAIGQNKVEATIDTNGPRLSLEQQMNRCSVGEGSWVRLTPCWEDPFDGQTVGQLLRGASTCMVDFIDWQSGRIGLTIIPMPTSDRYRLASLARDTAWAGFEHATIDESPSDYVAVRVDRRLSSGLGDHMFRWFDTTDPRVPPQSQIEHSRVAEIASVLGNLVLPGDHQLWDDQVTAAVDGINARVQLLQGPPGTGKTTTTAAAALARVVSRRSAGDIILLAAHTHTALDRLLNAIAETLPEFMRQAGTHWLTMPAVRIIKVHSDDIPMPTGGGILDVSSSGSATTINREASRACLLMGGTTNALLKLTVELSRRKPWSERAAGFSASGLIVDEASMMVFPHFLALATLVDNSGEIMLAGDHRQLAPIVAHDWEREDRPPAVLYQPFVSSYDAVARIAQHTGITEQSAKRSALSFTFRLPKVIVDLIKRVYELDDIDLRGLDTAQAGAQAGEPVGTWDHVWRGGTGLYLVLHDERGSRTSNLVEGEVIRSILSSADQLREDSVAIITPHRAQRSLLRMILSDFTGPGQPVGVIDTVERLQGGERPTIIVSATASDPAAISARSEFLLDLNRSNVAFSRTQERLIVVCSQSLIDHIPADAETYASTMLWKSLRGVCTELLAVGDVAGNRARVYSPRVGAQQAVST